MGKLHSAGMNGKANAASVALIAGDRVLLVRRARQPALGLWTLPGGRLEAGETAEQCAAREVGEELGLTVSSLRPVTRLRQGGFVLQVFATDRFEGGIAPSDEIADHRWVQPEMIAGLKATAQLGEVLDSAMRLFNRR